MKILLFANTDWFLYNFRLDLAQMLREHGHEVVLVSPMGVYVSRIKELGFRWIEFPIDRRGVNPFAEMLSIANLVGLYRREKPDLVHHFTVKCMLYGSIACYLLGIHSVVNSVEGLGYIFTEGIGPRRLLRTIVMFIYRLVLKPTWVIFQNPDDRIFFLDNHLVDPSRIDLIRSSGVDIQKFSPRPFPSGTPLVILPARMLWDKGVGEFVEAARQLKSSGVSARFVLVGDIDEGNPASVPPSQLQNWAKEGVIEWWGWKEDMAEVYAQASVICLPSYREGVPKTLIEAAACGRPLVASDVPGCREVVHQDENGLLVPVQDAVALADALKNLLADRGRQSIMGSKSRLLAEKEFSKDLVNTRIVDLYQTCITPGKPGK